MLVVILRAVRLNINEDIIISSIIIKHFQWLSFIHIVNDEESTDLHNSAAEFFLYQRCHLKQNWQLWPRSMQQVSDSYSDSNLKVPINGLVTMFPLIF